MKKQLIKLKAEKENGNLFITIKATPDIEQFFIKNSEQAVPATSQNWTAFDNSPLSYYQKNDKIDVLIGKLAGNFYYFDDFGSELIRNRNEINLAILRTVGITAGVKIKVSQSITYEELKKYVEGLAEGAQKIFGNYILKRKLTATITYEI